MFPVRSRRYVRLCVLVAFCGAAAAGCGESKKTESLPTGEPAGGFDAATSAAESDAGLRLAGVTLHGAAPREAVQVQLLGTDLWVSDGRTVFRYPVAGGEGWRLRLTGAGGSHLAIVVDGLFTIDPANGELRSHDPETSEPEVIGRSPTLGTSAGLHLAGDQLVWATKKGLYRMAVTGGEPRRVSKAWARGPLAVAGGKVFLSDGSHVIAVALENGSTRRLAPITGRMSAIQVAGDRLYWLTEGRIASLPVSGGEVVDHTSDAGEAGWMTTAPGAVYWLENPADAQATIKRSTADGSEPEVILRGPIGPGAAAATADRLYFASAWEGEAALLSLPLP